MNIIGLDVGGANIKASDGERRSVSRPFPLWRDPDGLCDALRQVLTSFERFEAVALTMTGELADCFATKAEGIGRILAAAEHAAGCPTHVWQTSGEFVSPEVAREFPRLTAAANWHALATWAGRMAPDGPSLLIDVGSTTSDIIPLLDGMPVPAGRTDLERLLSGELVYTGARRTLICAVAKSVPLDGRQCPLAAELFATMEDVFLILGDAEENPDRCDTADGRPATIPAAQARLSRMLCCDETELLTSQVIEIAAFLRERQLSQLTAAITKVVGTLPAAPGIVLISGEGEIVARRVVNESPSLQTSDVISLAESLGPAHSQAACAFALARLGRERLG